MKRTRKSKTRNQLVLLLWLCWLGLVFVLGQTVSGRKVLGRYQQFVWHDQHGLPENTVFAVTRTRDGYLWIATVEGVARFDGVRFTVFDSNNTSAIKHNHILALLEDHAGNLWLGTNGGGLTRYRDGQFTRFSTADGLTDDRVRSLAEDPAGNLWLGTDGGGLTQLREGRFTAWALPPPLAQKPVRALVAAPDGSLWIGTDGGLARLHEGRFTTWTTGEGLPHNQVQSLCLDRFGNLWVGMDGGGLARFRDGKFTTYGKADGLTSDRVYAVYQDREENLWVGTHGGGLHRGQGGRFAAYSVADGLPSDRVNIIYQDPEGDLWVGTNGYGLCQIREGRVSVITTEEGLVHDYVRPIVEDLAGDLWVGTVQGLSRVSNGAVTSWTDQNGLPHNHVQSLGIDRAGDIWIGTRGGLAQFKAGRLTAVDAPITNIRAIVTDNAGNCWFGTYGGGLARLRDGQFTLLTTRDGLPNNNLEALFVDRAGDLWVGTWGGGISRYRDGQFTTWTMKDGLASNHIYAFYEDFTGALWIGTGGGGLSRFKDGKFSNVTIKDGLYDNLTYCLLSDKTDESGDLWMNSNKGVFRASLRALNEFCDGRRASVSSTAYGIADGMLNRGGNRAQPAGWKTRAGNLLFATLKGLVIIDPQKRNLQPPLVKIEGVKLAGQSLPSDSLLQLKPGQGNLEIQYTGLSWRRPQQIGFKYQMVGLDQDWVEAGTRRTAYYPHLPPGEYTFRVIADNGDGVWNTTGQSMRVVVLPPFYQTWWFRMLTALAAAGLITLAWKIRVRQLEAKRAAQQAFSQQLIESQEAERKRIAGELHDSLGQNLIVIKNWAMLGLAFTEPDAPVREQLDEISTTALQSLNDVRSIIHNLRPYQLDTIGLSNTLRFMIEQVSAASGIQFQSEIAALDNLFAPEAEVIIFRIVQECVNNIVKHARATEAKLLCKIADGNLQMTIADNGRGLSNLNSAIRNPQSSGLGLTGLSERVRILHGTHKMQSASGQGTTHFFTIPIPVPDTATKEQNNGN